MLCGCALWKVLPSFFSYKSWFVLSISASNDLASNFLVYQSYSVLSSKLHRIVPSCFFESFSFSFPFAYVLLRDFSIGLQWFMRALNEVFCEKLSTFSPLHTRRVTINIDHFQPFSSSEQKRRTLGKTSKNQVETSFWDDGRATLARFPRKINRIDFSLF